MPEYSAFVKHFNTALPAPTCCAPFGFYTPAHGGAGEGALYVASHHAAASPSSAAAENLTYARLWDSAWRTLVASDASIKENVNKPLSATAAAINTAVHSVTGGQNLPGTHPSITVGRMSVSTEDRWRLQVQMRREEAKSGQSRKEYNKKVTRAIISTKGPGPDGFPAGRGRPL